MVLGLETLMKNGDDKEIYHIGNNHEISIYELAQKITSIMGSKIKILSGKQTHYGGTQRRCPSIEKISKFGYIPKTDLDKGLNKTINWYLNNINVNKNKLL